jgi:AraC-like DNA-binding protein
MIQEPTQKAAGFRPCKRCGPDQSALEEQHAAKIANSCRVIEAAEEEPTLDELAQSAGLSAYHFHGIFKAITGVTPKAYAIAHRQNRVREKLGTSKSVTEAIYDAGFNSSGRFYANSSRVREEGGVFRRSAEDQGWDDAAARTLDPRAGRAINLDQRNADAQEFIAITGADFREGHGEAYYAPGASFISMPAFESFKDADCFYATSFHELGHWTAHKSRLDRDLKNRFGSRDYAAEELVAELASAFIVSFLGSKPSSSDEERLEPFFSHRLTP